MHSTTVLCCLIACWHTCSSRHRAAGYTTTKYHGSHLSATTVEENDGSTTRNSGCTTLIAAIQSILPTIAMAAPATIVKLEGTIKIFAAAALLAPNDRFTRPRKGRTAQLQYRLNERRIYLGWIAERSTTPAPATERDRSERCTVLNQSM